MRSDDFHDRPVVARRQPVVAKKELHFSLDALVDGARLGQLGSKPGALVRPPYLHAHWERPAIRRVDIESEIDDAVQRQRRNADARVPEHSLDRPLRDGVAQRFSQLHQARPVQHAIRRFRQADTGALQIEEAGGTLSVADGVGSHGMIRDRRHQSAAIAGGRCTGTASPMARMGVLTELLFN